MQFRKNHPSDCPFLTGVTLHGVCTMTSCIDADIRADEAVIAYGNTSLVEDNKVEVGKEPLAESFPFLSL